MQGRAAGLAGERGHHLFHNRVGEAPLQRPHHRDHFPRRNGGRVAGAAQQRLPATQLVQVQHHRLDDALAGYLLGATLDRLLEERLGRQVLVSGDLHQGVEHWDAGGGDPSLQSPAHRLGRERRTACDVDEQQPLHSLTGRTISSEFSRPKSSAT